MTASHAAGYWSRIERIRIRCRIGGSVCASIGTGLAGAGRGGRWGTAIALIISASLAPMRRQVEFPFLEVGGVFRDLSFHRFHLVGIFTTGLFANHLQCDAHRNSIELR